MIKKIAHIGIVVDNIDDVLSFLKQAFGAEETIRVDIPEAKQISSMVNIGDGCFELIEPTDPDGVSGKFLREKGGGLHHISLLCEDVLKTCDSLENQGVKIIGKIIDGPFKGGFIHPKSAKGILFELKE